MMHGLYTGATGMKTLSSGMNVVGNNLANVNTIGFKQSMALYEDLISQDKPMGGSYLTGSSQVGLGSAVADVRVIRTQGAFIPGSESTDLAIAGTGFFQVVNGDNTHYTRAGNFRFTNEGVLVDPNGFALMGHPVANGKEGPLAQFKLPLDAEGRMTMPPKATTSLTGVFNLGFDKDSSASATDPFFGMLTSWDGTKSPPLEGAGYSQSMRVYDSAGKPHEVTVHFDNAMNSEGKRQVEFLVTMPPGEDAAAGTPGAGLLMSGTLQFNSSGQLEDMMAFTPTGGDRKNLASWTPAALDASGKPQFTLPLAGGAQTTSIDFGLTATSWRAAPASAAAVGVDGTALGGMSGPTRASRATTAYAGSSSAQFIQQDGYPQGSMMNLSVGRDGTVSGKYSNGEVQPLFRVPLFRFTSEDGLRSEGMNHYSATPASGRMDEGKAGTENFGTVSGNALEQSNVDMTREMVTMIITQRGFQTNSKVVTTADAMIQKALEIKR